MNKPLSFTARVETDPDHTGRARFCLEWADPDGVFRPEPSKDGKPVGFRRAQYFRANLDEHVKNLRDRGHSVTIVDERGHR